MTQAILRSELSSLRSRSRLIESNHIWYKRSLGRERGLGLAMADLSADAKLIAARAREITSLDQRGAYLERACSDDLDLLAQVRALLESEYEGETLTCTQPDRSTPGGRTHATHVGPAEPVSESGTRALRGPAGEAARTTPSLTIPGYEIIEVLGRGGMGVVYKAKQLRLKRWVALKMIRAAEADEEGLARFRSEAEAVARLQHPNIVQIHEIGGHDGQPYITFEFITGGTLGHYVKHTSISTREAAEIVEALARAIHHAHTQGIIHRDLKPDNVLLAALPTPASHRDQRSSQSKSHAGNSSRMLSVGHTSGGLVPKITDFGLAKQLDADNELTRTGAVLGTPNYMAPEQASGSRQVGPTADVYSLGAILYFVLTGRAPFRGNSPLDTVWKVQNEDPEPPRKRDRTIASDLETICLKCMEKDPRKRYVSAGELADDLRRFLDDEPVRAQPPSSMYKLRKYATRHRGPVLSGIALLVMLFGGVLASLFVTVAARQRAREVSRLSDIKLLAELKDEYAGLPDVDYRVRREEMGRWLGRAKQLIDRLAMHRSALDELHSPGVAVAETAGQPNHAHEKGVDRQPVAARSEPMAKRLQRENLEQLVRGIESLMADNEMLAHVKAWASLTPFDETIGECWTEAIAAIASEHNVHLNRQEGLFPLGRDAHSRLWEFVDLRFGLAPARGDDGNLVVGNKTGFVFVLLPGGSFRMGSPEDEPSRKKDEYQHDVSVSPFMISKYEITQAQWEKVMHQNPSETVGTTHPAGTVSWIDAAEFCRKTGLRLPTEAQWEYACRAGTTGPYSSPSPVDELGWYNDNAGWSTHPVGQKAPNGLGLYDMHGNVLEFCQDVYSAEFYLQSEASQNDPVNDSDLTDESIHRVLRGGSYEGRGEFMRSADRYHEKPGLRWRGFGVRPVRPIE